MSTLQLRPMLSSLHHHKLTVGLLVLQVALSCAIVANAAFMVVGRVERISTPTGIAEDELSMLSARGLDKSANHQAQLATDLDALRRIPGITAAVAIGATLPLSDGADDHGFCPSQQALDRAEAVGSLEGSSCLEPTFYSGSSGFRAALGARLVAGRDFLPEEYTTDTPAVVIVTRSLAAKFWPGESALGKSLYNGDAPIRVVGVIDDVLRPQLRNEGVDRLVALWPSVPDDGGVRYLLRSDPAIRQRVLHDAADALRKAGPDRLIPAAGIKSFTDIRHAYFQRDVTMIGLLVASTLGLLFVTALGIAGLANFWVQQRRRQIGIRRAIGATRGDIQRHFQAENFLIVGAGVVLGMLLAFALNQWLMGKYALPRLPLSYLPIGAITLCLLGQFAVWSPARRAAAVPPAVATRSP